jgi:CubicO group peptidase (beta-lactamase class C family)
MRRSRNAGALRVALSKIALARRSQSRLPAIRIAPAHISNHKGSVMRARSGGFVVLFALGLVPEARAAEPWPTKGWAVAEPRAVGLDSRVLDLFDADIAAGKYGNVDSMLIIRHGKAAYERHYKHDYDQIYGAKARTASPLNAHDPTGPYNYFNPWWHPYYRRGDLHSMQSVTKTVTSVVIGVARTRKEFPDLDTPILKFFDVSKVKNLDERKRKITIRHLLTMTAGQDWREDLPYEDPKNTTCAMEASFDWVQFALDQPMATEPGTVFKYNSGATQLLSFIFHEATGRDIEEYAAEHLFRPLGIEQYHWKRSPTGLIDTEGGLYLRPDDVAKIVYLFMRDGAWDGKVLVDPEWVKASLAPSVTVVEGKVKYGFKWWLYAYGKDNTLWGWGGSGFGGQLPIVLPDHDLLMVFTGWNVIPSRPSLGMKAAIDRVVAAVLDGPQQRER